MAVGIRGFRSSFLYPLGLYLLAIHSGIDSTFLPAPSDVGHALVGSRGQILLQVITPYIIPSIIDAFQINISTSYFLEFSSCYSAASEGLGKRIL